MALYTPAGFAASSSMTSVPAFVAPLVVEASSPNVTIITGGVTITITGTGFSTRLSANRVYICGRPCRVIAASPSEVRCVAPSMLPYPSWNGDVLHSSKPVLTGDYLALTLSGTSAITQLPGANTLMQDEVRHPSQSPISRDRVW